MSEKKQKATPKVVYAVNGDKITREDTQGTDGIEEVAKYDEKTGIVEPLPGMEKYRMAVVRHLNDKAHKYTDIGKVGDTSRFREDIPIKPKMSLRHGEKTPAVVEWYAKYHPLAFRSKFNVKQLQIRTGFEEEDYIHRDMNTGRQETRTRQIPIYENIDGFDYDIEKLKSGEQRLLATAKTHLTTAFKEHEDMQEYDLDEVYDPKGESGGTI